MSHLPAITATTTRCVAPGGAEATGVDIHTGTSSREIACGRTPDTARVDHDRLPPETLKEVNLRG